MTDPDPHRLLIAWAGDVPRIKAFLDAHRTTYDLTTRGQGTHWRVTIRQHSPLICTVTARIGDALRFHGPMLLLDKRPVNKRLPPPRAAREPLRRTSRTRNRALT